MKAIAPSWSRTGRRRPAGRARWSRPGSARTRPPPPPGSGRGVRRRGRVPPARRQRSWPHRPGSHTRGTRSATSRTAPGQALTATPSPAGTRHSRPAGGGRRPRNTARRVASRTGQRPRDEARISPPPRKAPAGSPTGTTEHGQRPDPSRLPSAPAAAGTAISRRRSASHQPRTERAVRQGGRSHRPDTLLLRVVDGRSSQGRDPRPGTALIAGGDLPCLRKVR